MLNASQYPNDWVMSVTDNAILWERPLNVGGPQSYLSVFCPNTPHNGNNCMYGQSPAGWMFDPANASRGEHVVFLASQNDVQSIICKSRQRGSPDLYIHNLSSTNYGSLSSLFEQTVNFAQGYGFCADVWTAYCGTASYDPCGTYLPGCQEGMWCPGGLRCVQLGYQYWDCQ
jgi:hypothetical protein